MSANPDKYTVRKPNQADRTFDKPEDAVAYIAKLPGPAKLFGPEGLVLTKGTADPQN